MGSGRIRERRFPLLVWSGTAAVLLVVQHLAGQVARADYVWAAGRPTGHYLQGWLHFDGHHYLEIATDGYRYTPGVRSTVVWFPLYPLAIRLANVVLTDPLVAGVVVSLLCGLAAALVVWRWLGDQGLDEGARAVSFVLALCSPYAWYLYGVVYADALFLLLVVGALVAMGRRRPVVAVVLGALATATRPTGLALVPALLVANLVDDGVLAVPARPGRLVARFALPTSFDRSRWSWRCLLPLGSAVGVIAYSGYLGVRFGAPLAWITNQSTYHPEDLPVLKLPFVVRWRDVADDPTYTLTITAQAALVGLALWSVPAVCRRFGAATGLFVAGVCAQPLLTSGDFMGSGRYLLVTVPVAALWGERLAVHRGAARAVAVSSWLVMVALGAAYARSWYLS